MENKRQRMHQQLVSELLDEAMAALRRPTAEPGSGPGRIGRIARRLRERREPGRAGTPADFGRGR